VTHDQSEALTMSDRVAVFNDGVIQQLAKPDDLYERPQNAFVAQFIGDTNLLKGTITARDGRFYTIDTESMGPIMVTTDRDFKVGDAVLHAVRPEKIAITKQKPASLPDDWNVLPGKVFESIYSGFQSRFDVDSPDGYRFKVYKQHESFLEMGPEIKWTDDVWLSWDADDGYLVEKTRP